MANQELIKTLKTVLEIFEKQKQREADYMGEENVKIKLVL